MKLPAILVCPVKSCGVALLAVVLAFASSTPVKGHVFERTRTELRIDSNRNFEATLRLDLDALALGIDPSTPPEEAAGFLVAMTDADFEKTEAALRSVLARRLRVRVDGNPMAFDLSFPQRRSRTESGPVEVFGLTVKLEGKVPEGGQEIQLFASRSFPAIELSFIDESTGRNEFHICLPGEECPRIPLAGDASGLSKFQFVALGFKHIVPLGVDHILFVFALFLGGRDMRTLLIQTALFTLAHSATLALSTFGVFSLPPRFVEPLIALSIGLVGLENVFKPQGVSRRRAAGVFAFGLLHGLGFAGVLAEAPLEQGSRLLALLLFNVGVELGQVAVLAGALLLSLPFRDPVSYRQRVERPLSMALAVVGVVWALTRLAS